MSYARHFYGDRLGERLEDMQPKTSFNCDLLTKAELTPRAVTLVVVDMQPGFWPANNRKTIDAVARLVKHARSMNWSIVFLEFDPWRKGNTLPELTKLVEGYDRTMTRVKSWDNGASLVLEACYDFRYGTENFWVAGVETDLCVKATAKGLQSSLKNARVRVIQEACNSDSNGEDAWKDFPHNDRLVVSSETVALGSLQEAA